MTYSVTGLVTTPPYFFYDTPGRMIRTVDAYGAETTTQYDSQGRTILVSRGAGQDWATEYDAEGRITTVDCPQGVIHYSIVLAVVGLQAKRPNTFGALISHRRMTG